MMDSTLGISGDLWSWGYTMETPLELGIYNGNPGGKNGE